MADDGVGFPSGFIEQFSSDYPLKGSSSDSYGLGLSIVSDITRKYGGSITLKNLPEGGAQVVLFCRAENLNRFSFCSGKKSNTRSH